MSARKPDTMTTHSMPITTPEDMSKSRAWARRFFSRAADLPISFVLDGKAINGIPEEWQPVAHRRRIDANISETVFEGTDPRTGLNVRVECTEYHDYPVMEWVAWFTNKGHEPTPVIRDILRHGWNVQGVFARSVSLQWRLLQRGGIHASGDSFACRRRGRFCPQWGPSL